MPWDVTKAVKHLKDSAEVGSKGWCAKYTRQAIEAGGVTLTRHGSAKDYGQSLKDVGFVESATEPAGGYKAGDVAVIQGFTGHPHGHMQMYDGSAWISDFKQRDFWPGSSYRKTKPSHKIYRYPTLPAGVPAPPTLSPRPVSQIPPYPGMPIREGSKGSTVRAIQNRLAALGSTIQADGVFGPRTKATVQAFQRSRSLTPDGVVGPQTWEALFTK